MLHVLNGDATAAVFAGASLTGERLVWRDILVEGPVAAGTGSWSATSTYGPSSKAAP